MDRSQMGSLQVEPITAKEKLAESEANAVTF
jgi:hypothetical protein